MAINHYVSLSFLEPERRGGDYVIQVPVAAAIILKHVVPVAFYCQLHFPLSTAHGTKVEADCCPLFLCKVFTSICEVC